MGQWSSVWCVWGGGVCVEKATETRCDKNEARQAMKEKYMREDKEKINSYCLQ